MTYYVFLELEPWNQLDFILQCFRMQQTKFYPFRWRIKVLATKKGDKLILHLPVTHTHFCKKTPNSFTTKEKTRAIELYVL
jgi:hypothetical protein